MIQGDPIEASEMLSEPHADSDPGQHERVYASDRLAGDENQDADGMNAHADADERRDERETDKVSDGIEEEDVHDAVWVQTESYVADKAAEVSDAVAAFADDDAEDDDAKASAPLTGDLEATFEIDRVTDVMAAPSRAPKAASALENAAANADEADDEPEQDVGTADTRDDAEPRKPAPGPSTDSDTVAASRDAEQAAMAGLGLQAINALGERLTSMETRYDSALDRISHAISVIGERIDGMENRMTDRAIQHVELPADLPREDSSVAPYIANAERELEAKKEARPLDIFDRIARAAETEFDVSRAGPPRSVIDESGDSRRIGTKKWTPSKTLKRRMQKLDDARGAAEAGGMRGPSLSVTAEAASTPPVVPTGEAFSEPVSKAASPMYRSDDGEMRVDRRQKPNAAPQTAPVMPEQHAAASSSFVDAIAEDDEALDDMAFADESHDDAGLSVLPGARGRRRDRARKSRLDEDFEDVFGDEEKPSINRLRRKMRDTGAAEPAGETAETESEAEAKPGFFARLFSGKKKAEAVETPDADEDEDDLKAAFGLAEPDHEDDAELDDVEAGDDAPAKSKSLLKNPLVYLGTAVVGGGAFVGSYLFLQ